MNLFTPNLQFTLNASGTAGLANPGAFLQTFADGDSLQTNVTFAPGTAGLRLNHSSFVFVVRPTANFEYQPFFTLYTGATASTQCIGKTQDNGSTNHRYGIFEGDKDPYYGHNVAPSSGSGGNAAYGDWLMIAGGFGASPQTYGQWAISKINGEDPSGNKGGTNSSTTIDTTVEGSDIYLGWQTASFSGNNIFELAMARVYNSSTASLTDEQSVQIWDHWASNNQAYFENNSQTSESYNEDVEDYTTDLLAEWDFAKMPTGVLQTTAGSVGTVIGSLTGGAVVTV